MSTFNLNLLPSQARFQATKIKLQKKVKLILIIMVSIWVAVVGLVLIVNLFFKIRVNVAQAQYDKAKSQYMSMSDNIVTSQRLKYKAKLVAGVLDNRFEYGKAFEVIAGMFPSGIVTKDFELKDRGTFVISGETSGRINVDLVETIIADINAGRNEDFANAVLKTIGIKNNVWSFEMEVKMR